MLCKSIAFFKTFPYGSLHDTEMRFVKNEPKFVSASTHKNIFEIQPLSCYPRNTSFLGHKRKFFKKNFYRFCKTVKCATISKSVILMLTKYHDILKFVSKFYSKLQNCPKILKSSCIILIFFKSLVK